MSKRKDKPPLIEVQMTPRGIRPLTALDAERMVELTQGHVFELKPATSRSWPQLKTYWKALGIVVKATGRWPSVEKLHKDIKFTLGYVEESVNIDTGEVTIAPDSIALDKMEHADFCRFMDQAMELLTRECGFDPLSFLEDAA